MELWIRSQDKETLMKVNRIDIDDNSIICYDNDYCCSKTYMGQYKTKGRALEVLDHIQFLIEQTGELTEKTIEYIRKFLKDEKWSINSTSNTATYKMPKE